jgi:hypothetical protein
MDAVESASAPNVVLRRREHFTEQTKNLITRRFEASLCGDGGWFRNVRQESTSRPRISPVFENPRRKGRRPS